MKSGKLMISVILPVKNGRLSLLNRAISSIKKQTYQNYEILLIDDGSNEDYSKKLDWFEKSDRHIRLFHIKASGVSYARNFAASEAKGDIITYIDGDDAISPFCFEEAISFFDNDTGHNTDALWGGTFYGSRAEINRLLKNTKGGAKAFEELKKLSVKLSPERIHMTRSECIGAPYRFGKGGYINRGIAARFIRKSVFEKGLAEFPVNIKMYEDTIWNLEMMASGMNIYYVKSIWYYYYKNERSVSNSFNENVLKCIEIPLMRIRNILDLSDPEEYAAYTRFLMDSLRYVYKCKYGNPSWKPDISTKMRFLKRIYDRDPWREISQDRFIKAADRSDKIKAVLYRARLLFLYWKLTWKKM